MKKMDFWASVYCVLAGLCDGITGLLLWVAPAATLKLMGVATTPTEPVYMQWIGAFVFSIGTSYLLPFLRRDPVARARALAGMLAVTTWVRVIIAVFSTVSITTGSLDGSWWSVPMTDVTFAVIQLYLLRAGAFRRE